MTISAYPLTWPEGWPRSAATARITARFSRGERQYSSQPGGGSWLRKKSLTVADGVVRVVEELSRLGIDRQDVVISTHVRTRLDGLPRSGEREPEDPGAAVYWVDRDGRHRVMAIDRYDRVADNLAAIAATLEALRAIERHGGGEILDRAFTGFAALPAPDAPEDWRSVLGVPFCRSLNEALDAYKRRRSACHPDKGGRAEDFYRINRAIAAAEKELSI